MARNYIPLQQVIGDFLISMDGSDWASHTSDAAIRNIALRGLRELGFDSLKVIRSLKVSVNTANNTATLPDDYVDWSKVGVVGSDGLVYVLGCNPFRTLLPLAMGLSTIRWSSQRQHSSDHSVGRFS